MTNTNNAHLQETNWGDEWKKLQQLRRKADDSAYWDKRSESYDAKDTPNDYTHAFLTYAGVKPGEVVLDMGCGTGNIAIPLSQRGCTVIAADFSQGMLDTLTQHITTHEITGIQPQLLAWADDWEAAGIIHNSVDVAIASRSISTDDMEEALDKLHNVARRRCCISLPTGCSPRMDARVLDIIGTKNRYGADHQYAWNILQDKGRFPECRYIKSVRNDTFDSLDDALEKMGRMIDDVIEPECTSERNQAYDVLKAWIKDQLIPNTSAGLEDEKGRAQKAFCLREPRIVTWACITWDT